ncbi:MAG TPA: glycoside hydrolase family 25 protein [Chitinophagaceae bacterium]|jgi:lysozyme
MEQFGYPGIIDIYYKNNVPEKSPTLLKDAGIIAIIHKATEATDFKDPEYHIRKKLFKEENGFLWGSYHLTSNQDVLEQVEHYLSYAKPENDELIAFDFERSKYHGTMKLDDLVECVDLIESTLHRVPVVYGGRALRSALKGITESPLSRCPLWYARYRDQPIGVPKIWKAPRIWQYSNGADGPEPKEITGFGRPDRGAFNGSKSELRAAWPL